MSFVVCQAIGLEAVASASEYVQIWSGNASLLRESLEAVLRTAAVILGGIAPEPTSSPTDSEMEAAAKAAAS